MNTKNVVPLVTLLGGAVASIVMIVNGTSSKRFLISLLIVLIVFCFIGSIIKVVLDKSFNMMGEEPVDMEFFDNFEGISDAPLGGDIEETDSYTVEEKES